MAEETKRTTGTVKWFSAQKGFGFIASDDGGEDLFVHQTSIKSDGFRTLSEGQPVEFTVDFTDDGRSKAVDVVAVFRSRRPSRAGRGFYRGRGRDDGGSGSGRRGARGGRSFGGGGGGAVECYNCGRYGHLARDCYQGGGGGGGRGYGRGGRGGGGGGGQCYSCGEEGHFARDCPIGD